MSNNEKRDVEWAAVVGALRLYYLQGNSHIDGVDDLISDWTVHAIDHIRNTPRSIVTAEAVKDLTKR